MAKLTNTQKARIEAGYAMLYTGAKGAERYIENVFDIYDKPSKAYRGKVYVWLNADCVDWDAHPDGKPLTLGAAQAYVDGLNR